MSKPELKVIGGKLALPWRDEMHQKVNALEALARSSMEKAATCEFNLRRLYHSTNALNALMETLTEVLIESGAITPEAFKEAAKAHGLEIRLPGDEPPTGEDAEPDPTGEDTDILPIEAMTNG